MRAIVILLALAATAHAQDYPSRAEAYAVRRVVYSARRDAFTVREDAYPWRRETQLAVTPATAAQMGALADFPLRLFNSPSELDASALPPLPDGPTVIDVRAEIAPMQYQRVRALVYVKGGDVDGWIAVERVPVGAFRLESWWLWNDKRVLQRAERYPEDAERVRFEMQRRGVSVSTARDVERWREAGAELNRDIEAFMLPPRRWSLERAIGETRRVHVEELRILIAGYAQAFATAAGMMAGAPEPEPARMKPRLLDTRQRYRAGRIESGEDERARNPPETQPWPDMDGLWGPSTREVLRPGTLIDRYGGDGGKYFSPVGTSKKARSLPPGAPRPLVTFEVLKPLEVEAGTIAPWYGEPGGGVQYRTRSTVRQLVDEGYLRRLP